MSNQPSYKTVITLAIGLALSACASAGPRVNSESSGMPDWVISEGNVSTECVIASNSLSIDRREALGKAQVTLAQQLESQLQGMTDSEEAKLGTQAAGKTSISTKTAVDTTLRNAKILKQDYATINGAQYFCVKVGLPESQQPLPSSTRPPPAEPSSAGDGNQISRPTNPSPAPLTLSKGKRVALVIGNSAYSGAIHPLTNPVNDANDIAAALGKLGFDVALVTNADLPTMDLAVRKFLNRLEKDSEGLFYFSGHGVQAEGSNYLVPLNAEITNAAELKARAYDLGIVLDGMEEHHNRLNLVFLDACRNNPFKGFKALAGGLASASGPEGTLIAFASAPNTSALDNRLWSNSLYTKHLLLHIAEPGTIEEMLKKVRSGVKNESKEQTPWENSSLTGDFCFASCK